VTFFSAFPVYYCIIVYDTPFAVKKNSLIARNYSTGSHNGEQQEAFAAAE
jgi:hypothetical protein